VVVVPAGYLALVLIATRMRGGADDRLMGIAVAEAASSIRGAVFDLMPGLQLEAFIAECRVSNGRLFVRVVEWDVVFIRRP